MSSLRSLSAQAARLLPLLIGGIIAFNLIGFVIAVAGEYPSEFDCDSCTADGVLADAATKGSLLAAPLTVLVVLAIVVLLTWRGGRLGAVAGLLIGVVFMIGVWGEPLDPEKSDRVRRSRARPPYGMARVPALASSLEHAPIAASSIK